MAIDWPMRAAHDGYAAPVVAPADSLRDPAGWGLAAAVALYLLLSAPTLAWLGIPYEVRAGSFPSKIHPGSYLLLLAWLVALCRHGNPLAVAWSQCRRHALLALYLACMVLVFGWAVARHGPSGLAFFVDTLIMPGIACLTLLLTDDNGRRRILQLVVALMAFNSAVALGEFALQKNLVPLHDPGAGLIADEYFRATALLGHPLTNAMITVTLLPSVVLVPWSTAWRCGAGVLMYLALLSFGGRSSMAFGTAVYGAFGLAWLAARTAQGRYSYRHIAAGLLLLSLGAAAMLALVATTHLGDRIFHDFTWDRSAEARVLAVHTLDFLRGIDWWIGLPLPEIDHYAQRAGIEITYEAIENFWIYQFLLLGFIGFVPFALGIVFLVAHLLRSARPVLYLGILVYFATASGANTLSSKTISLLMLAVAVQCSKPPRNSFNKKHGFVLAGAHT